MSFVSVVALLFVSRYSLPLQQSQYETTLPPQQLTFGPIGETEPNVSPDGRWLAFQYFSKNQPGFPQIWIMEIAKGFTSARRLAGIYRYAGEMSWSPDSKWISFISSLKTKSGTDTNQIFKVNITTDEVAQITTFADETVIGDSTAWLATNYVAFERDGVIYLVPSTGGKEIQLLDTRDALSHQEPSYLRFSPNGKMLIFSAENATKDQSSIWLANIKSKVFHRLTKNHFDLCPAWIDDEHILFIRQTGAGWSEVEAFSLRTGNLNRITSMHTDFTPSTDPLGRMLYISRENPVQKEAGRTDYFDGFHIWRTPFSQRESIRK
ncbi:MAG TPA: hypothetical protein VKZ53_08945 [Candidatus Angelobacter sp.]|nr:hypothetical protein [Candidatus Angelobacter sp.]